MDSFTKHVKESKTAIEKNIKQWNDLRKDYIKLSEKLVSYSKDLTVPVHVPLGKHAFMPGYLYHTNEVTMLLGDNWFVKKSSPQALEVIERRRVVVDQNIESFKTQLNSLDVKTRLLEESGLTFGGLEPPVNEEGLPIVELREEIDNDEPIVQNQVKNNNMLESQAPKIISNFSVHMDKEIADVLDRLEKEENGIESEDDDNQLQEEPDALDVAAPPIPVPVSAPSTIKGIIKSHKYSGQEGKKSVSFDMDVKEYQSSGRVSVQPKSPKSPQTRESIMPELIVERSPTEQTMNTKDDIDREIHEKAITIECHKRRQQLLAQFKPPTKSEREKLLQKAVVIDNTLATPLPSEENQENPDIDDNPILEKGSLFKSKRLGDEQNDDVDDNLDDSLLIENTKDGKPLTAVPEVKSGRAIPKKISKFKASRMAQR